MSLSDIFALHERMARHHRHLRDATPHPDLVRFVHELPVSLRPLGVSLVSGRLPRDLAVALARPAHRSARHFAERSSISLDEVAERLATQPERLRHRGFVERLTMAESAFLDDLTNRPATSPGLDKAVVALLAELSGVPAPAVDAAWWRRGRLDLLVACLGTASPGAGLRALRFPEARAPDIEAMIRADRDDREAIAIYADWLLEHDSAHGRVIEAALRPSSRRQALRYGKALRSYLPNLDPVPEELLDEAVATWALGFVRGLDLRFRPLRDWMAFVGQRTCVGLEVLLIDVRLNDDWQNWPSVPGLRVLRIDIHNAVPNPALLERFPDLHTLVTSDRGLAVAAEDRGLRTLLPDGRGGPDGFRGPR